MDTYLPTYAELYAVSDIHMGGEKTSTDNFQIFNRGERLAGFIDFVGTVRPTEEVALLLNGDIIDSLAEDEVPGYVALDANIALKMMDRISNDPSFQPVWDALAKFVKLPVPSDADQARVSDPGAIVAVAAGQICHTGMCGCPAATPKQMRESFSRLTAAASAAGSAIRASSARTVTKSI